MKYMLVISAVICVIAIMVIEPGCRQQESAEEKSKNFMQKGLNYYNEGKFARALRYFEKSVAIMPDNPKAHLYAAMMYDELDADLGKAAQYYEYFISVTTDPDKKELARQWLADVELRISRLKQTVAVDDDTAKTERYEENDNDQQTLAQLKKRAQEQAKTIQNVRQELNLTREMLNNILKKEAEYKETIETLTGDLSKLRKEVNRYKTSTATGANNGFFRTSLATDLDLKQSVGEPGAATTTYTVQDGDTLKSISLQLYGDESLWTVLWETNKFQLADAASLTIGQVLVVPRVLSRKMQ